jgi:phenylacetate-CoA ligase
VTDLTGKLMPFIRYDQGDWATYEYRADMRGHLIPVIRQIQGRDGDLVQLPDGTRRTTHDFSLLIKRYEGIQQFQVVQHARDRFRVLVVADESYLAHIHDDLLQSLHSAFPPEVTFALVPAKNIEPDSSGKTKLFVREIPAPNRSTS